MTMIAEEEPWRVTTRINKAGNLALEVELHGQLHAELVLQDKGVIDLGTKRDTVAARRQGLGHARSTTGLPKISVRAMILRSQRITGRRSLRPWARILGTCRAL